MRVRFSLRFILFLAAFLAPPIAMLLLVRHYAVNVPFSDEWVILDLVLKSHQGTLDFTSLWQQHNEHRLFIVNIISVLIANRTQYNLIAIMYCGYAFEFAALLLAWRMLAITLQPLNRVLVYPLAICASLLLFWTESQSNWIWAIASLQFFSSVFWAVATVWALAEWKARWPGLILATAFAFLGLSTAMTGLPLIVLPPIALIADERPQRRIPWKRLAFYAVAVSAFLAFFFRDWKLLPRIVPPSLMECVRDAVGYFFVYLGSPFQTRYGWRLGLAAGILIAATLFACLFLLLAKFKESLAALMPWVLLSIYVFGNATLTAYGRFQWGLAQAMSSRYNVIAILLWISTIVLVSLTFRRFSVAEKTRSEAPAENQPRPYSQTRPNWTMNVVAVICVLLGLAAYAGIYADGLTGMKVFHRVLERGRTTILNYRLASDAQLQVLYPAPRVAREGAAEMEQYHLGPFAKNP